MPAAEGTTGRIARTTKIFMSFGVGLIVWGELHRDPNADQVVREVATGLLGIGASLLTAFSLVLLEDVLATIRPKTNERVECGVLWSISHMSRLRKALSESDPAKELTKIYYNSESMKIFKSHDVYQAIQDMNDGAFLATVHLWGSETYDEGIMRRGHASEMSDLQRGVWSYRERVARAIASKQLLAARRYRVNASDIAGFVRATQSSARLERIASLLELACEISHDRDSGWYVDVEFHRGKDLHNPKLDYALLFGAREKSRLHGARLEQPADALVPRVAYITHSRNELESAQDYVGVSIADPALVVLLMEDRAVADPSVMKGQDFVLTATGFLRRELAALKVDPALASVADKIGRCEEAILALLEKAEPTGAEIEAALDRACDSIADAVGDLRRSLSTPKRVSSTKMQGPTINA